MNECRMLKSGEASVDVGLWVEAEVATLSLISQSVRETTVRLGHLREFPEVGPGMSIEAPIVIDARDLILILTKQLL